MAEKWNRRSGNFGKKRDPETMKRRTGMVLDFLKEAGFKAEGAKVLDIGCGNGALALPLARMGAKVTAFDISSGMLKRINEDSEKEGLQIETVEASWWSADIDKLNSGRALTWLLRPELLP
jgi:2-polyprenyl-3-methyl-5-hydroxy-6-metoxy-1,4-benzoquinol methylase